MLGLPGRSPHQELRELGSRAEEGEVTYRKVLFVASLMLASTAHAQAPDRALMAAALQHHNQVPGFYRLKVGDLEVTALFDGFGVFDPHWLNGTKATMDGVVKATINGTRSSKATITTLMTQGPKAPFTYTGT